MQTKIETYFKLNFHNSDIGTPKSMVIERRVPPHNSSVKFKSEAHSPRASKRRPASGSLVWVLGGGGLFSTS